MNSPQHFGGRGGLPCILSTNIVGDRLDRCITGYRQPSSDEPELFPISGALARCPKLLKTARHRTTPPVFATVTDLTTGHWGMIVLNGSVGPLMPAFDTQTVGNSLGWGLANDAPNSFVWEIGHQSIFGRTPGALCAGQPNCNSYNADATGLPHHAISPLRGFMRSPAATV